VGFISKQIIMTEAWILSFLGTCIQINNQFLNKFVAKSKTKLLFAVFALLFAFETFFHLHGLVEFIEKS